MEDNNLDRPLWVYIEELGGRTSNGALITERGTLSGEDGNLMGG